MKHSSLVLALFFAALCLLTATSCSQKSTSDPAASKPTPQRPTPDFTVTATDLYNEANADSQKAEEKYAGKQIAVTGQIFFVYLNPPMISLDVGRSRTVRAKFDEAEGQSIATLVGGRNVTIQCVGGDLWAMSDPDLRHCVIVKVK